MSTAVALAMLAREELGKSVFLEKTAQEVQTANSPKTVGKLKWKLADHLAKQKLGHLSTTLPIEPNTPIAAVVRQRMQNKPGSKLFKQARVALDRFVAQRQREAPAQRHGQRMASTYVDISDDAQDWLLPRDCDPDVAYNELQDAINDYALKLDHRRPERLAADAANDPMCRLVRNTYRQGSGYHRPRGYSINPLRRPAC